MDIKRDDFICGLKIIHPSYKNKFMLGYFVGKESRQ